MFSLSLRHPLHADDGNDFFNPWSSRPMWDVEMPVMLRHLDDISRGLLCDQRPDQAVADPKKFDLKISMRNFRPEDIKVKVEGDNVTVEAKREHKTDKDGAYSYTFQEMRRTFPIPKGADKANLSSHLTKKGVLEIEAPLLEAVEEPPTKTAIEVTHATKE